MSVLVLKYLIALTEKVQQMLKLDHAIKILALYLEKHLYFLFKSCHLARITFILKSLHSAAEVSIPQWQVNYVYTSYLGPDSINTTIHASLSMPIVHASLQSSSLKWVTSLASSLVCKSMLQCTNISHLLIF